MLDYSVLNETTLPIGANLKVFNKKTMYVSEKDHSSVFYNILRFFLIQLCLCL